MSTNAAESSSSRTLALSGLNVVAEDESDYVFVIDEEEWAMDDDESSYDHCDLSPSLSCATSVATNVTLRDLNLIEDSAANAAMMDVDEDPDDAMETEDAKDDRKANNEASAASRYFPSTANPKNGRRLSNKKLRKKVKMLKKAAAARAAAEAALAAAAVMSGSSSSESTAEQPKFPSSNSADRKPPPKRRPRNVAVACVQEARAVYREEVEAVKAREKKARAVSIDVA